MDAFQAAIQDQRRKLRERFRVLDAACAAGHITARERDRAMALEGIMALGTLSLLEAIRDAADIRYY